MVTKIHPPVHREGVRTHTVVQGTGEGGGGGSKTEKPQDQELWGRDNLGGAVFYWAAP